MTKIYIQGVSGDNLTHGNFSYKPGRLISMIWQARKHFFVLLIILLVMKVVLIHHAGSSAKLLSLTLKILIGYVVKKGPN